MATGGSGGKVNFTYSVTQGNSCTVVVGAGGYSDYNDQGGKGGNTTITYNGTLLATATGGGGAKWQNYSTVNGDNSGGSSSVSGATISTGGGSDGGVGNSYGKDGTASIAFSRSWTQLETYLFYR